MPEKLGKEMLTQKNQSDANRNNNKTFRLTFIHKIQLRFIERARAPFASQSPRLGVKLAVLIDDMEQNLTNSIISDCCLQINMFDFFQRLNNILII